MKNTSSKKNYFQVKILTPEELSDAISNYLIELGTPGVTFQEEKKRTSVIGYFKENSSHPIKFKRLGNYLTQLKQIFPQFLTPQLQISKFKTLDWSKNWRKNFKAILVTRNILVKPPWIKKKFPQKVVISIYPQMAFGTGEHSTTQMCLILIERFVKPGFKVLDLGTGSGILAIASSKFGAERVVALDIDSDAIQNARKNMKSNKLKNIKLKLGSLNSKIKDNYFDLAVANLNFTQIKSVFNQLKEKLAPNGILILSGLLIAEEAKIKKLLKSNKFDILRVLKRKGWISVAARKTAHN